MVLAFVVILLEIFAVPVADILGDFEDPALQAVLANCLRLISPALILFGIWGGVTGLFYALKRFNYTALSAAVFNLGIVIRRRCCRAALASMRCRSASWPALWFSWR